MPRPKRDLVRANFYLQSKVVRGLRKLADLRATNVSDIVRTALKQYVVAELQKEQSDDAGLDAIPPTGISRPVARAAGDG